MNKKKGSLWESKEFRTTVKVINFCLIVGLMCYFVFVIAARIGMSNGINKTSKMLVSGKEYIEAETESGDVIASDLRVGVYYALLQGSHAEMSEDLNLSFGLGGIFEGFFDNEHPDVTGYTYEVLEPVDDCDINYEANVNIYNEDKSVYVQYKLLFNEESNMQLYYPDSKKYMVLSF